MTQAQAQANGKNIEKIRAEVEAKAEAIEAEVAQAETSGRPQYKRVVHPTTGLTVREEMFVQSILSGKGNRVSAIAAGYKPKGAQVAASRLLRNKAVIARIEAFQLRKQVAMVYGVTEALREAEEARQLALTMKQAGALSQATRLKADLAGLLVQKVQTEVTVKTAEQSLVDLSRAIDAALVEPEVVKLLEYQPEEPLKP